MKLLYKRALLHCSCYYYYVIPWVYQKAWKHEGMQGLRNRFREATVWEAAHCYCWACGQASRSKLGWLGGAPLGHLFNLEIALSTSEVVEDINAMSFGGGSRS